MFLEPLRDWYDHSLILLQENITPIKEKKNTSMLEAAETIKI